MSVRARDGQLRDSSWHIEDLFIGCGSQSKASRETVSLLKLDRFRRVLDERIETAGTVVSLKEIDWLSVPQFHPEFESRQLHLPFLRRHCWFSSLDRTNNDSAAGPFES